MGSNINIGNVVAESNKWYEEQLAKKGDMDPAQKAMLELQHEQATESLVAQTLSNVIKSHDDTLSHISNKIG